MMIWFRLLPLVAASFCGILLMPTQSEASEYILGTWAAERRFCSDDGENAPFRITRTEMYFYEYHCDIRQVSRSGKNQWTAQLTCQYDGPPESRVLNLRATEGRRLTIEWDNGATENNFIRCR